MGNSQLCVAVTGRTMSEIRRNRDAATGADIVEMRLDTVDRPDVAGALEGRRCPVIVTCRAAWENGFFQGSEEERRRILEQAFALGAEFVDVEAKADFAGDLIAARRGRGVIVSSHVYRGVPGRSDRPLGGAHRIGRRDRQARRGGAVARRHREGHGSRPAPS